MLAEIAVVTKRATQMIEKLPDLKEIIEDQKEEILRGKVWGYLNEEF